MLDEYKLIELTFELCDICNKPIIPSLGIPITLEKYYCMPALPGIVEDDEDDEDDEGEECECHATCFAHLAGDKVLNYG